MYIIVLLAEPAQGYELNIYSMYSSTFWILVSLIVITSIAIITLSEYWRINDYWQTALLSMIGLYLIILLLPLVRGYYMFALGSYDVFTHLSLAQHISNTGHINTHYPGAHILLVNFHDIAGVTLETATMIVSTFFSILYILFLCILGRSLQRGPWISLLPILFALPLLYTEYHRTFHPYIYALFIIPLLLYVMVRYLEGNKTVEYRAITIILSFIIVYFHPLITLFLILSLFGFLTMAVVPKHLYREADTPSRSLSHVAICDVSIGTELEYRRCEPDGKPLPHPGLYYGSGDRNLENKCPNRDVPKVRRPFWGAIMDTLFNIHNIQKPKLNYIIQIIGILFISFCAWYLSFYEILRSFRKVFDALFDRGDLPETILGYQVDMIASSDSTIQYIVKLFILNYGPIFSYLVLGLICTLFVFIGIRTKKTSINELSFSIQYIIGITIAFLLVTGNFILNEPVRAAGPAIMLSTILIPIVFFHLIQKLSSDKTKIIYGILASVLVVAVILSLLNIFTSPLISCPSWHMTYMEKDGLHWFLGERETNIPVLVMEYTYYHKFEDFYAEQTREQTNNRYNKINYQRLIPTHFGYNTNTSFGEILGFGEYYYISSELNRQYHLALPENRREMFVQVTINDFERLKQDESINLLYSNGEFESWLTTTH